MVFTIHRYIFRDLLKAFVLGTLVLSVILGLGVMLKPLQRYGVDPARVPELLLFTLPITLTMVMPVTALLAATITYGRLAADREVDACRAGGIGMTTLIYPALVLALLVGMATLLLAFHVIPSFTERSEAIIQEDIEKILYRNIQKTGCLKDIREDIIIHADRVYPDTHQLVGVAAIQRSKSGVVERIYTARQVDVEVLTNTQPSKVILRFQDAQQVNAQGDTWSIGQASLTYEIPSLWEDSIEFKRLSELKAIREDMTLFGPLKKQLARFRKQYMHECFVAWCHQQFGSVGLIELETRIGKLQVYADECMLKKDMRAELLGTGRWPIRVDDFRVKDDANPKRKYSAKRATLSVSNNWDNPEVVLTLEDVKWYYADEPEQLSFPGIQSFTRIQLPSFVTARAREISLDDIRSENIPTTGAPPSKELRRLHRACREEARELEVDIEMEVQARLAFGVSCVVLVIFGTLMGIVFRSGHLLTAFGVSSAPAALCLIAIVTGKHIAEHSDTGTGLGVMFLWSGIVTVSIISIFLYKRLTKN